MTRKEVKKEIAAEMILIGQRLSMNISKGKVKILRISRGAKLNGEVHPVSNAVYLTQKLMDLWDSEKDVVRFILAHELVHNKYKDTNKGFWARTIRCTSRQKALVLLFEMRANIEGATAAGLSEYQKKKVQKLLEEANSKWDKESAFKVGYPTREMIADYTTRYSDFTLEAQKELLEEFCTVLNIKNKDDMIEDVMTKFANKHQVVYS